MSLRRLATAGLALILGAAVLGVFTAHRDHLEATSSRRPLTGRVGQLIPDYPGTAFFPMGRALHVDGLPREMAYAVTDDEPAKVADRYEAIWESQGYEVDRQDGEVESWVTARASEDPWVRSIVISRSGRRTTIIASVSGADAHGSAPRVPVPDYCDVVQHTGATDIGIDTQAVMLNCEGYARQVFDFYDTALHGSRRVERMATEGSRGAWYITYSGAGREVMLAVKQHPSDPPRTAVTLTWQESR